MSVPELHTGLAEQRVAVPSGPFPVTKKAWHHAEGFGDVHSFGALKHLTKEVASQIRKVRKLWLQQNDKDTVIKDHTTRN